MCHIGELDSSIYLKWVTKNLLTHMIVFLLSAEKMDSPVPQKVVSVNSAVIICITLPAGGSICSAFNSATSKKQ